MFISPFHTLIITTEQPPKAIHQEASKKKGYSRRNRQFSPQFRATLFREVGLHAERNPASHDPRDDVAMRLRLMVENGKWNW